MRNLLIIVAALACVACDPHPPSVSQAVNDVNAMVFVRHQNGLCFGVVRFTTYSGYQGVSVTNVPTSVCGGGR